MTHIFISLMAKDVENNVYMLASYKSSSKTYSSVSLFVYGLGLWVVLDVEVLRFTYILDTNLLLGE